MSLCILYLTENGSVYTWGQGNEGQLGHGQAIKFLSHPRRVKDRHVSCKCIQISCGEAFSAAVTGMCIISYIHTAYVNIIWNNGYTYY